MTNKLLKISRYSHKITALKYVFWCPTLPLTILNDIKRSYFLKTFELQNEPFDLCLYSFLPEEFLDHLNNKDFFDFRGRLLLLYGMVRKFKPEIVVETGVAKGESTAFILCAMYENRKGHLYSIDLPSYEAYIQKKTMGGADILLLKDGQKHTVNSKYHVGELVPEYLKDSWTLILGDSKKELPKLLERIGKISIFLHDSLHTYDHMMFEYETAWPYITKRGFLLSHDIFWNDAFMEFCKKGENKSPLLYYSLGILRKEREDHKP